LARRAADCSFRILMNRVAGALGQIPDRRKAAGCNRRIISLSAICILAMPIGPGGAESPGVAEVLSRQRRKHARAGTGRGSALGEIRLDGRIWRRAIRLIAP
jgi:hypothetical protein